MRGCAHRLRKHRKACLATLAKVYSISSAVKSGADKTLNDLRDKRMLTFNQNKLQSMSLEAKGPRIEFTKNEQLDWQIAKPRPLRADALQAQELIRRMLDTRMDLTGNGDAKEAGRDAAKEAAVSERESSIEVMDRKRSEMGHGEN